MQPPEDDVIDADDVIDLIWLFAHTIMFYTIHRAICDYLCSYYFKQTYIYICRLINVLHYAITRGKYKCSIK